MPVNSVPEPEPMSRIAYVNGRYLPQGEASVHIEDRGFQFADGVYEICEVRRGAIIDETRHLDRLDRSLSEIRLQWPVSRAALQTIMHEVVRRNRVVDGLVYVQATRGAAPRDHVFPASAHPTLVVTARMLDRAAGEAKAAKGIAVITMPDIRWKRPDIKTVQLLPNALARQTAKEAGAQDPWLFDEHGFVTEGAATNAWIVTRDGAIVTRQADRSILRGVTRTTLLDTIAALGLRLEERPFSVAEATQAAEAFITGATTIVMPVVAIDGSPVGQGAPGPVAKALRAAFHQFAEAAETPR